MMSVCCTDRDGGLSDWGNYTSCSATCGTDGVQTRTRACTNPTPEGNGADCEGDLTETSSCNIELCPEQLAYGITLEIPGVTAVQFASAESAFTNTASDSINGHCTYNSSVAMECCNTSTALSE